MAPPQCVACGGESSALCSVCATSEITPFESRCWRCSALSPRARACDGCRSAGGPRAVWISTNYEGVASDLVQAYKFGHLRAAAKPLVQLMAYNFINFHRSLSIQYVDYLVVPVPTATSRARQRGFDHSALLARLIARELRLKYFPALGRLGQQRQVGALRAQRLAQAAGNYYVRAPEKLVGKNVLLVDDVITTGGTLIAATRALRGAGAKHVDALVFAKKL